MLQEEIDQKSDLSHDVSASAFEWEFSPGAQVREQSYAADQLVYATQGILEATSGQKVWVIPPGLALWMPADVPHRIRMEGLVRIRTVFFAPGFVAREAGQGTVLRLGSLVRELIGEAVRVGRMPSDDPYASALASVLAHHVAKATPAPTFVTMPTDPRARAVAEAILGSSGESTPLAEICASAGVSLRTVQRIFKAEVGLDLDVWRRQARLTKAMQLLIAGASVKDVSYAVGYGQASAFVQAFRRLFGETPKAWVAQLRAAQNSE